MRPHTGVLGALLALTAIATPAVPAHAQADRDCRDFVFQEDAQAVLDADRSDPNRLDEDQGPDDGTACEALPHRGGTGIIDPVTPAATPAPVTSPPVTPSPVTSGPLTPAPTTAPSQGVRGGLGGAATDGPSRWETGVGLAFAGGATLTAGYLLRRRRT